MLAKDRLDPWAVPERNCLPPDVRDDLEDVVDTCLSLDKSGEHIREEGTLIHSRSRAGLPG